MKNVLYLSFRIFLFEPIQYLRYVVSSAIKSLPDFAKEIKDNSCTITVLVIQCWFFLDQVVQYKRTATHRLTHIL
jgi:hypothetical protein